MLTAPDALAGRCSWLRKAANNAAPVWVAFFASILLSLIALKGSALNPDGMLYVDTARMFAEGGFHAAIATFAWPFFPILMVLVSQVSGLGLETSGHLINILFMAGTCALLVACAVRMFPVAAWQVCLVVLALPGFNGYRDELLREYGCWFFVMLSFWLALRWSDAPRWPLALAVQASIVMATLFRPEALVFFAVFILWQVFAEPVEQRWQRVLQIGGLPLIGLTTMVALYVSGNLGNGRLAVDFGRLSLARFDAKAIAMASAFIDYAHDQARIVLFYGSLAIVPIKFINKIGIFIVPLLYSFSGQGLRPTLARNPLFAWAFLGYLLVLGIFVLDMQFLSGRYVGLLILFSAPLTGYGFWRLTKKFPRWTVPMLVITLLIMISNVITFSPSKSRHVYVEAGEWLAKNVKESPRVYVESGRVAYYAGWRYAPRHGIRRDRKRLKEAVTRGEYDWVVLVEFRNEPEITPWLESAGLAEIRRFVDSSRDEILIAKPK